MPLAEPFAQDAEDQGDLPLAMVIEGDPSLSCLIQSYLEQSDHRVVVAGLGEDALSLARREQPGLIVLGAELPRKTGREVLKELKSHRATRDIPVLVYSWLEESRSRGLLAGAAGYLQKPVRLHDFRRTLAEVKKQKKRRFYNDSQTSIQECRRDVGAAGKPVRDGGAAGAGGQHRRQPGVRVGLDELG